MTTDLRRASRESVRRLAVTKQHLAGKLPTRATRESLLSLVREIAYVQWDPITIVAPSHHLSLWARLGNFRTSDLEHLLWTERSVFLHWTPIASIVPTADYPLYASLMHRYPDSLAGSWGAQSRRAKQFLSAHAELRTRVLRELKRGSKAVGDFPGAVRSGNPDGWSFGSDVSLMLFHLTMTGEVMVVGHRGNQNVWGLAKEFLPKGTPTEPLTADQFECEAAQRAIRVLGTATPTEINYHFVRGRYQHLRATLQKLEAESTIHRVQVEGANPREERYVHDEDASLLESIGSKEWTPRMSLLPPFDNLIFSQARTLRLFGFDYVREQFLPKEKRRYGLYVLPILWGDSLIGRIDPRFDRSTGTLVINSVHAEPDWAGDRGIAPTIHETVDRLADFLGADRVTYPSKLPRAWASALS